MRSIPRLPFCACALALLALSPRLAGQSSAAARDSGADGAEPCGNLVQGRDGNFYGTTLHGGVNSKTDYAFSGGGTVFEITATGVLTTLHRLTGADGVEPYGGVIQGSDGNFYGTASAGGSSARGTVFKITPAGKLTTLHSFTGSNADGSDPRGGLIQGSDGNYYGTTEDGLGGARGTVFKITPAGVLTTLHSLTGKGADGAEPYDGLVQGSDGNFYGTTYSGGGRGCGTIFKITPSGAFTVLHRFTGKGTDGVFPCASLVLGGDGNFYGTTKVGGSNGAGTFFKITPAGVLTTLHCFGQKG